ncbi:MAG: SecY-interacting protein Syd [Aminipila sp.]
MTENDFKLYLNLWIDSYKLQFHKPPTAIYNSEFGKDIYISEPNESGYATWNLVKIKNSIDFLELERKIEMDINEDLKVLWDSFYYLELNGTYKGYNIDFLKITPKTNIKSIIENQFRRDIPKKNLEFKIGNVEYKGNDELILLLNNNTGKIYMQDLDNSEKVLLANSITELFSEMEFAI